MADLERVREVGVLDEVQLLGDPHRGWAWTRALLGLPVRELHLCGSISALPIVEQLAEMSNEPLELREYERKTPLVVSAASLRGDISRCEPGDCLVAFSRRELFGLRHQLESVHKRSVAMVYGSLPPENRLEQCERFNSGQAEVLVASDAVGMGLNLNIKRVVLSTMHKFDGEAVRPISPAHLLQIGGRAGRYQSAHSQQGEVLDLKIYRAPPNYYDLSFVQPQPG